MDNRNRQGQEPPLAEGIGSIPEGSFRFPRPPDSLRASVLERTEQVLAARAGRRSLIRIALVAAAYIGGIVTAFLVTGMPDLDRGEEMAAVEPAGDSVESPLDPDELVARADTVSPGERARLLAQAGDLYLSVRCDVEKALRCYRWALNAMPEAKQTVVEPDDSWLLVALKDSRR